MADAVVVTEIYAARETYAGFSSKQLVDKMPYANKHYSPNLDEATLFLEHNLQSGDIVLVLSAGDANLISAQLLAYLKGKEQPHG